MSKFNFDRVLKNIEVIKRDLPRLLANDAQNYFLKAFRNQGWNGSKWDEPKRRLGPGTQYGGDKGTAEWRWPKNKGLSRRTMPILQGKTGKLRREVSNLAGRAQVTYSRYNFTVTLKMNENVVPYAYYINNGSADLRNPPRRYMGDSPELRQILRNRIDSYLKRAFSSAA